MTHRRARPLTILLAIAVLAIAVASPASAQYFGRNKVRYERFDFKVLKTEHFDVYYYEEEAAAAEMAGRMAERWYERLSRLLEHTLSRRQPLILYSCHPHFEQTEAISGDIGEGTGGVTEFMKRRIVLPLAGSLQESDHVIGHELVHAFQMDITGSNPGTSMAGPAMAQLPLWFIEGMAEYLSVGPHDPHTAMWIRDAARSNKLPTIPQLYQGRYFPYRFGQAVWAYVGGRFGDQVVGQALKAVARVPEAERAIAAVTGVGPDTLSREWQAEVRRWNEGLAGPYDPPERQGRRLIAGREDSRYNIGPALSPDGRWMTFLSERTLFSIEMFLADANTGRVVRKLTRSALDPHVQSIQFIQSAGSFSPDGRHFAYASIDRGQPLIQIYDLERHRDLRTYRFDDLGEIFHPTWSPDAKRIAFTAQVGGFTDLFTIDLDSGRRTRLTDDPYSAMEPAWSPDGHKIAFVTDRFTTDLERMSFGRPRLALLDVASGEITALPALGEGKQINPQWTRDGSGLYFVSDRDGISDVYRLHLADGVFTRVTHLATGVSGITPLSPVISSARNVDKLVITVYENGSHNLYALDSPEALAGRPLDQAAPRSEETETLPPVKRENDEVAKLIGDPALGLPGERSYPVSRYRPGLSLDNVSNVGVGFGVSGGSVAAGGGATLYFSDMLGDHNLVTLLQVSNVGNSIVNNVAAAVAYGNQRSRWDWGLEVSQFPYVQRSLTVERLPTGEYVERDFRQFQVERSAILRFGYPADRSRRIELSAGTSLVDFSAEVEESVIDPTGQVLLSNNTYQLPDSVPSLRLGVASIAMVYDNSYFGGTSPVLGQRYRVEVAPTFGDLNFTGVLADYRRYVPLAGPLTLAGRLYHYGRYGRDAENDLLTELYLGYPWLVRGYDDQSFTLDECEGSADDCPAFDRLFGSRLALANVELRLPLLGGIGLVRAFGIPPVEVAGFFDIGSAWRNGMRSPFETHGVSPVSSQGVAARINLLGFAVAELDYVKPNDRPRKDWYWLFSLQPGF